MSVFNIKQTAVVFEAEILSAGSAIDLNNTGCADRMQREKTRWGEEERLRKRQWERIRRQEMKGVCKQALRQ